jgi:hypothetical protein
MPRFIDRIRSSVGRGNPGTLEPDHGELLAKRILEHFPTGSRDGRTVRIGMEGISVSCSVESVSAVGSSPIVSAALYFHITGGPFGPVPMFASISGYGPSAAVAIVEGACLWACTFRTILRSAFLGAQADGTESIHDVTLHGRKFTLHVDRIDRVMTLAGAPPDTDGSATLAKARGLLGGSGWLLDMAIDSGALPPLATDRALLLSAFSSRFDDHLTTEVKVRGGDWPPATAAVCQPAAVPGMLVALRELGILVPATRVDLDRVSLQAALAEIGRTRTNVYGAAGWRGWRTHEGRLGNCWSEHDLAEVEREAGSLPPDYRAFLLEVAGPGAGPGYGLLSPRRVDDVVPLAWGGCGVMWVLRLSGPERGQVWVDARWNDHTYTRVAPSFAEWYADWVDAAIGLEAAWHQWDNHACAAINGLARFVEMGSDAEREAHRVKPNSNLRLQIKSGGGYMPEGTPLDPCHACVIAYASYGLPESSFEPGVCSGHAT